LIESLMINRPVRVVLVRPRDPLNIGACARAMANFGLSDLVVVDPYEPVWQETRSAPGAEPIVLQARAVPSWGEAVKGCSIRIGTSSFHQRPLEHSVVELPNLNKHLSSYPASDPLTLIFGSERSGLSNEELSRCQAVVRIPTQRSVPSMNLGQAVAIVLYEMRRSGWDPVAAPGPAPAQELESLIESLAALGQATDYPHGYEPAIRLGRFRAALKDAILPPSTVRFFLSFTRWLIKKSPR
jgi:tRNA/rRNA methyltransferase